MAEKPLYEIARTWAREVSDEDDERFGDIVEQKERVQLTASPGALAYVVDDQPAVRCEEKSAEAAIANIAILNEIRPNHVTRIAARPEIAKLLPLLLAPTGEWGDYDESLWSEAMYGQITDELNSALPHDIYRVLHVNESRWHMWHTDRGYSMLPGSEYEISLEHEWAYVSLYEVAEMNSGMNRNTLGLVTPVVIAEVDAPDTDGIYPEEGSTAIRIFRWTGESDTAAQILAEWVLGGPVSFFFYGDAGDDADPRYFVQLFVEAATSEGHVAVRSAEELIQSTGYDLGFFNRGPASTQFSMILDLEQPFIDATLELIGAADTKYRDMILAARDENSAEAKARDARLADIHAEFYGPN